MHFCRQPPPRPRLRRDTHALLPAAPAPPAPSQKDTHALPAGTPAPPAPSQKDTHALPAGTPAPPRLRRPSPGGGVRAWRYLVESRARVFPGLSPCSGPWWISPSGERLTGRGDTSPLPCLQIPILRFAGSPYSASSGIPIHFPVSPPPRLRLRRDTPALLPAPPTPPAPAALLPRPREGAGSVRGDIRRAAVSGMEPVGNRIRLFSRFSPCCGPCGYRHGGRG